MRAQKSVWLQLVDAYIHSTLQKYKRRRVLPLSFMKRNSRHPERRSLQEIFSNPLTVVIIFMVLFASNFNEVYNLLFEAQQQCSWRLSASIQMIFLLCTCRLLYAAHHTDLNVVNHRFSFTEFVILCVHIYSKSLMLDYISITVLTAFQCL